MSKHLTAANGYYPEVEFVRFLTRDELADFYDRLAYLVTVHIRTACAVPPSHRKAVGPERLLVVAALNEVLHHVVQTVRLLRIDPTNAPDEFIGDWLSEIVRFTPEAGPSLNSIVKMAEAIVVGNRTLS